MSDPIFFRKVPLVRQRPSCLPYVGHDPPLDPIQALFYIRLRPHEICQCLRKNGIRINVKYLVKQMYKQSEQPGFARYIEIHGTEMSRILV